MRNNSQSVAPGHPDPLPGDRSKVWTTANLLTSFRILLTIPFLYLIWRGSFGFALAIYFLASITDFIDGYVARNFNQQSRLGQMLDPLADKLLTTAGFVVMAIPHEGFPSIPLWLAVAVVLRDILILLGSLAIYLKTGFKEFKPTRSGRVNTFFEMGLIVVFLGFHTSGLLIFLLPLCYLIVLVSVLVSGGEYVIQGIKILNTHRN